MRRLRTILFGAALLALVLLGAEAASRLDDAVFADVPFLANPDRDRDLTLWDGSVLRGRPHGRFKKWRLNAFGFRGPEIAEQPPAGVTRVLVLGASETFGLYETDGKEYPRQLEEALRRRGPAEVEVVNAALAGMTASSMRPYWQSWASRFHPTVVLIYPSPLFYLDDEPPGKWATAPTRPEVERTPRFESRFFGRVREDLRRNAWLRRQRVRFLLATGSSRAHPPFPGVPTERLELYKEDLANLVQAVRASGAEPVLATHAHRAAVPPRPEDGPDLEALAVFYPRATPGLLVEFEQAANATLLQWGRQEGVKVIDSASLNGHREWFADLVHFNDDGAARMAEVLADALLPALAGTGAR